ncbi:MAG: ImmA/IrrE family metallo-endopeptidase [Clostridia bacterium]|nr:ImmA/IrrE family metallo-endopeptidase [Clostridia bacterium]
MTVQELYTACAVKGIETHSVSCPRSKAISMEIDGAKFIGLDKSVFKSEYTERLVLAHELGHALTDAYYTRLDNPINVKRMEHRATKKTVELLIPKEELSTLLNEDSTVFQLAEHFSVPEEMIKTAMLIYFRKELL